MFDFEWTTQVFLNWKHLKYICIIWAAEIENVIKHALFQWCINDMYRTQYSSIKQCSVFACTDAVMINIPKKYNRTVEQIDIMLSNSSTYCICKILQLWFYGEKHEEIPKMALVWWLQICLSKQTGKTSRSLARSQMYHLKSVFPLPEE